MIFVTIGMHPEGFERLIRKEVMVAYQEKADAITILTVHALKKGRKENRIVAGRWVKP